MKSPTRRYSRRARGMMVAEAIFGLMLMALVLTVLLLSIAQQRAGQKAMTQQREAMRLAERAMLALQTGAAMPPSESGSVTVDTNGDGTDPADGRWVRVTARHGERTATMVGLVPANDEVRQ